MMDTADKSTLVDDTANKTRQMVFNGQLQPGELLPSRRELAEQYGEGISTIHEAIQSLATVGLVDSCPGKGTWIRHDALEGVIHPSVITHRFGQIDVVAIYKARLMLEVTLAELAAQRATPEDGGGRPAKGWAALTLSYSTSYCPGPKPTSSGLVYRTGCSPEQVSL